MQVRMTLVETKTHTKTSMQQTIDVDVEMADLMKNASPAQTKLIAIEILGLYEACRFDWGLVHVTFQ